ncbi:hypothetical protein [Nocardioides sp.]|uniref:hypothetical protein n=1 Tax=Nocardioides sp. TaxID=35761 RepID=UPI002B26484E|nr:hypothetical protein [Nocardioides sp.]
MSMPDELTTSLSERAAGAGDEGSSAATAATLSAVGYGLFAWLQPGGLESIHPMRTVTELVRAEEAVVADAAAAVAGPAAAGGHAPDTLFDEDLAAAELMAALVPGHEQPDAAQAEHEATEPARVADGSSYSTPRDTVAMLEEIAFLDE